MHTTAHEADVMSSWCFTGAWTFVVAARTEKTSGMKTWWFLRAWSTMEEATGCIGKGKLRIVYRIEVHVPCAVGCSWAGTVE